MKLSKMYLLVLLIIFNANATKVAVIDSGYTKNQKTNMCDLGHRSFINDNLYDELGHGTNVIGIISKAKSNFCIISYKIFSKKTDNFMIPYYHALFNSFLEDVDIVNLSLSGFQADVLEFYLIEKLLKKGVTVIVAAGNNSKELVPNCNIFPACYKYHFQKFKNFIVVAASDLPKSNYGTITVYEKGRDQGSPKMSGSSQAAANYTKKYIESLIK